MKFNKIILTMAVMTFSIATMKAQITFGITAGAGMQNITGTDIAGNKVNNKVVPKFNIGAIVEFPVADDFFFQTGLRYASKGTKSTWNNGSGQAVTQNFNLSYLELPLHFLYKPLVGTGHVLLGFGPYIAYGVGGKVKTTGSGDMMIKYKNTVGAMDTTAIYFKPLELGADIFFGYEFVNHFSIQLDAQLGLTKINPVYSYITSDKAAIKNSGFGISLAYRFGGK
jgi:hypothetical protein